MCGLVEDLLWLRLDSGDQVGCLNHREWGMEKTGQVCGGSWSCGPKGLTTDWTWGTREGKKQRMQVQNPAGSEMILSLRQKGKIRTVTVSWGKCDEIDFGHFQLELPVRYSSGNAQFQLAWRIQNSREKLGLKYTVPFPQTMYIVFFHFHKWSSLPLLILPSVIAVSIPPFPDSPLKTSVDSIKVITWSCTVQSLALHDQFASLKEIQLESD